MVGTRFPPKTFLRQSLKVKFSLQFSLTFPYHPLMVSHFLHGAPSGLYANIILKTKTKTKQEKTPKPLACCLVTICLHGPGDVQSPKKGYLA